MTRWAHPLGPDMAQLVVLRLHRCPTPLESEPDKDRPDLRVDGSPGSTRASTYPQGTFEGPFVPSSQRVIAFLANSKSERARQPVFQTTQPRRS